MSEAPGDFGTGLRAHLHLDELAQTELDVVLSGAAQALEQVAEPVAEPVQVPDTTVADALAAREAVLVEREYALALREANLVGRAASIIAAAEALYNELPGSAHHHDDELAPLRRRKTVA
jgi:hypothetical protein